MTCSNCWPHAMQSEYNRRSEARSIAAGKRRMPGGLHSPEGAKACEWLLKSRWAKDRGITSKRGVIDGAMVETYRREKGK